MSLTKKRGTEDNALYMAFSFALTNPGLEKSLIMEVQTRFPGWRLAFSAPGFVTFKGPDDGSWPVPVLARLWGECLGKASAAPEGADLLDLGPTGTWAVKVQTPDPFWPNPLQHSLIDLPPEAPSRAWLKIEEAMQLFDLPIGEGTTCLEVGCAPGGAAWSLLNYGVKVIGVDPAEMDPRVMRHPNFKHLKRPFQELTPDLYGGVNWWLSDLNLAPGSVLSHLGRLLREAEKPDGLILTLKMAKPEVALEFTEHARRVADWGYETHLRLLPSHNKEVLLLALK